MYPLTRKLKETEVQEIFYKKLNALIRIIDPLFELSGKEMADKIGISAQSFSDYTSGRKIPSMVNYIKIVAFFRYKIKDFNDEYLIGNGSISDG